MIDMIRLLSIYKKRLIKQCILYKHKKKQSIFQKYFFSDRKTNKFHKLLKHTNK